MVTIIAADRMPRVFLPKLWVIWRKTLFAFAQLNTFFKRNQMNDAAEALDPDPVLKSVLRMAAA